MVSTLAGNGSAGYLDGPSSLAQFSHPSDICDDGFGNIYVTDSYNYCIRLINMTTNQGLAYFSNNNLSPFFYSIKTQKKNFSSVSTFAGNGTNGTTDGPALNAEFSYPFAILCQPSTSTIFVSDQTLGSNYLVSNYLVSDSYLRKIQNGLFKSILFFIEDFLFSKQKQAKASKSKQKKAKASKSKQIISNKKIHKTWISSTFPPSRSKTPVR